MKYSDVIEGMAKKLQDLQEQVTLRNDINVGALALEVERMMASKGTPSPAELEEIISSRCDLANQAGKAEGGMWAIGEMRKTLYELLEELQQSIGKKDPGP